MSGRTSTKQAERSGPGSGLRNLVRDTMTEVRKVTWPDSETTRNLTILVIAMATALGLILGGIDALFIRIWDWIPN